MAQEMLLVNPRRRRRASPKRRRSTTAKRRRRNPIGTFAAVGRRRRARNPIGRRRVARRRNPIGTFSAVGRRRRRRNPISLGGLSTNVLMSMFKDAAIGGAGAIAMDVVMGQVNGFLPASLQTQPTTVGVGDAVKAGITALLGQALNRSTRGLSRRMAAGALTVQAYEIISAFIPAAMKVGYMSPARVIPMSQRVGPSRGAMSMQGRVGAYQAGARPPLLNAYQAGGTRSPLLNGGRSSVQQREGVSTYR